MKAIGKIMIRSHDSEQGRLSALASQRVFQLYQVVGGSPQAAEKLCRRVAELEPGPMPQAVAITLETLPQIDSRHAEVCRAIRDTCRSLRQDLYICGTGPNPELRAQLAATGVLEGISDDYLFDTLAALLRSFAVGPGKAGKANLTPTPLWQ